MNVELIKLSRKAAREWTGTDGYNQASQLKPAERNPHAGVIRVCAGLHHDVAQRRLNHHVFFLRLSAELFGDGVSGKSGHAVVPVVAVPEEVQL